MQIPDELVAVQAQLDQIRVNLAATGLERAGAQDAADVHEARQMVKRAGDYVDAGERTIGDVLHDVSVRPELVPSDLALLGREVAMADELISVAGTRLVRVVLDAGIEDPVFEESLAPRLRALGRAQTAAEEAKRTAEFLARRTERPAKPPDDPAAGRRRTQQREQAPIGRRGASGPRR
jgi:hypothetical protein